MHRPSSQTQFPVNRSHPAWLLQGSRIDHLSHFRLTRYIYVPQLWTHLYPRRFSSAAFLFLLFELALPEPSSPEILYLVSRQYHTPMEEHETAEQLRSFGLTPVRSNGWFEFDFQLLDSSTPLESVLTGKDQGGIKGPDWGRFSTWARPCLFRGLSPRGGITVCISA